MAGRPIEESVEILEQTVGSLEQLPEKVTELTAKVDTLTTEFAQFRAANDEAHSATRSYIGQMHELAVSQAVIFRDELKADIGVLRSQMLRRFDALETRLERQSKLTESQFAEILKRL